MDIKRKKLRSDVRLFSGKVRLITVVEMPGSEQVIDVDLHVVPTASPSAFLVQTSDAAYWLLVGLVRTTDRSTYDGCSSGSSRGRPMKGRGSAPGTPPVIVEMSEKRCNKNGGTFYH